MTRHVSLALRFGLAVEQIVAGVKERTGESVQRSDTMIATGRLITLVMCAASLIGSLLFVWFYVGRNVIGRITGLSRNMGALASGDLETKVAGAETKDEIGTMARALLVFRDNMQRSKALAAEQETAQERRNARVKRVDELTQGFDERISGALKTVDAAVGDMNGQAEAMAGVAEDTNRRSTAVAAAAGQASTNVQTVASATEELSASISEISRHVSQSAKIASQAVEQASRTNAQVESLSEAAEKIGDVVKLINDIAGQTNLLALNATIEAARAGDARQGVRGRGVGSEVAGDADRQSDRGHRQPDRRHSERDAGLGAGDPGDRQDDRRDQRDFRDGRGRSRRAGSRDTGNRAQRAAGRRGDGRSHQQYRRRDRSGVQDRRCRAECVPRRRNWRVSRKCCAARSTGSWRR